MAVCIEKKLTLSGPAYLFRCELLHWEAGFGMLKYVIEQPYRINNVHLSPGDITYALYWTNRPYTLYVWHLPGNRSIYYFNIADSIVLTPQEFLWRDLVVDVLVDSEGNMHILDENELPSNLSSQLSSFIEAAKSTVLSRYKRIIGEAERCLRPFLSSPS